MATPSSLNMTTLLTCGWGLAAFYILFDGLLVRHSPLIALPSLLPLIAVWATLERKRWGRLTLLGMCGTAPGVFVALLALAPLRAHAYTAIAALRLGLKLDAQSYGSPTATALILLVSIVTGLWLCQPKVAAEFNQGKSANLAQAQRHIAIVLVIIWGVLITSCTLIATAHLDVRPDESQRSLQRLPTIP